MIRTLTVLAQKSTDEIQAYSMQIETDSTCKGGNTV